MVLCGTLFKIVSAVVYPEKNSFFFISVSFHSELLGVINFGLVLDNCLANAKNIVKLSRISFYE